MNIAVIGAGVSGLTAACMLKNQGHSVTIFEQAPQCKAVGAGILLQPSGQKILEKLGLLDKIEQISPKLNGLKAKTRSGKNLVSIEYSKLNSGLYGLGVRRSLLFSLLLESCTKCGVALNEDSRIEEIEQTENGVKVFCKNQIENFDLVIAADGSKSAIRKCSFSKLSILEYDHAALWTLVKCQDLKPVLTQMVDGNKRLVGVLPVEKDLCSFFWGIRKNEKDKILRSSLSDFKKEIIDFDSSLENITSSINSVDDFSYATYRHVRLKSYFKGRVVFIGDAAHSSSPHLGQGVNLALEDAFALAEAFKSHEHYSDIFNAFQKERIAKNNFYSSLTYLLAPFFQSDFNSLGILRDIFLPVMPKMPIVGKHMVASMSGIKRSWFDFNF